MRALLVMALLGAYAPEQMGSMPLADPVLEARVQKLGKKLRCAVCQGMSIADSPASMARAQLDEVRKLVADGKSDPEVLTYFEERYGEWVLLDPKAEGFSGMVYAGPALALLLGFAFIVFFIRSRNAPSRATAAPVAPAAPPVEDKYLEAVRAELKR